MLKNNIRKLTKKPTLDFNNMSPFHAYILKKKKTHQNFRPKQTYSSFIMKMLDETPTNFNKTVKKISATTYKNLLKKIHHITHLIQLLQIIPLQKGALCLLSKKN